MRATSLLAYRDLRLPEAQAAALAALQEHGPATAMEIERASGLRHLNKRTSELVRLGHAREAGRRTCKVSGRVAIVWQIDSRPADTVVALSADGECVPSTGRAGSQPRRVAPSGREASVHFSSRYCNDHTGDLEARIARVGEACAHPSCGRFVASVEENVSVGGVVCRVTTTHAGA